MNLRKIAVLVVIALLIPSLSIFADAPGNSGNGGNNGNGGGIDNPGNGGGNGGNGGNAGDNNGNGGQGGSGGNGGGGGSATSSNSNTNSNSSSASSSSSSSNNLKVRGSFSQAVGTSSGQQTVAIGSMFFGGITVSEDTRSQELRRNASTFAALHREGLISEEEVKSYSDYVVHELKKESKPRKCLHLVPCGRILSNILS